MLKSETKVEMSSRINQYKNKALDNTELRRRREEAGVQIRKSKREEQLFKRRNVQEREDELPLDVIDTQSILDSLPNIVAQLMSDNNEAQLQATQYIRKMLSKDPNPPIGKVIEAGVVPRLVEFLKRTDDHLLQFEAAWALTNIASGSTEQTFCVVNADAVPIFIQLMLSPHGDVREQAVWALGNIAGDHSNYRNHVLDSGIMEPLLQLLNQENSLNTCRNAVWCLSNLCRGKNPSPDFSKVSPSLPTLARLLFHDDTDVLADSCWALAYLSDGPNYKIQQVIDAGVCRRLVELLQHPFVNVVSAALRGVGNIVTGDDLQTQVVMNCNVLPRLLALLNHEKDTIRKETCWTISNITAGNKPQIQAIIDNNIIPCLVAILSGDDFKTRKEAAWAIANATSGGTSQQIRYIASQDALRPLCDLLSVQDTNIVLVALTAIGNILRVGEEVSKETNVPNPYSLQVEECFGLDKIEYLQQHQNKDIYDKCFKIINNFFNDEDEVDVDCSIMPDATSNSYAFSASASAAPANGFTL